MHRQKGAELGQVGALGLGIDLPDEGLGGPLGADERVLAADEVQVAGPEQFIVAFLGQEGQGQQVELADRLCGIAAARFC